MTPLTKEQIVDRIMAKLAPHLKWWMPKSVVRHVLLLLLEHIEFEFLEDDDA